MRSRGVHSREVEAEGWSELAGIAATARRSRERSGRKWSGLGASFGEESEGNERGEGDDLTCVVRGLIQCVFKENYAGVILSATAGRRGGRGLRVGKKNRRCGVCWSVGKETRGRSTSRCLCGLFLW